MRKASRIAVLCITTASLVGMLSGTAYAYPSYSTTCESSCHPAGTDSSVAASIDTTTATTATYNVAVTGAAGSAWAVFDGSTKIKSETGMTGSFTVGAGKTYTVYAVDGSAYTSSKTSVSPALVSTEPTVSMDATDTTAPTVSSDATATYDGAANIKITAADDTNGWGVAYIYYKLDKHATHMYAVSGLANMTVSIPALLKGSESHTISYWAQDKAGNVCAKSTATFTTNSAVFACHYTEVSGANRYATAIEASKARYMAGTAKTVVIARGDVFADALGGSALAGAVDGPLLLTQQSSVSAELAAEITRLGATKVYVLGGTSAVSAAAFASLDTTGHPAVRLEGADRYATSLKVADETISVLGATYDGKAFMATGANFPDALGASPIAYAKGMPMVLCKADGSYTLPAGVTSVTVLGGMSAVPSSTAKALALDHKFSERLSGNDRYGTCAAVAAYGVSQGMSWDGVGIATGENAADALAGGALLGANNSVMLLTRSDALSPDAFEKLSAARDGITSCYFIGGTSAVSTVTRTTVQMILGTPSN